MHIRAWTSSCGVDPKFGYLTEIVTRRGIVRLKYQIVPMRPFLTVEDLEKKLGWELDIGSWEMNRTQWAVKDVDLSKELRERVISELTEFSTLTLQPCRST